MKKIGRENQSNDIILEIKITSLPNPSKGSATTGLLSSFSRAARANAHTSIASSLRGLFDANIKSIQETIKIFEERILNWDKNPITDEYALLIYVLSKLPYTISRTRSYYITEANGVYVLRLSGHNAKAKNFNKNAKYKVGITIQSKDAPITFESKNNVYYKEHVYYSEYLTSDDLRDILQGITDVLSFKG